MACAWRGVVLVFDSSIYSAGPGLGEPITLGGGRGGSITRVELKILQDPLIRKLKCLCHLNCGAMEKSSDF